MSRGRGRERAPTAARDGCRVLSGARTRARGPALAVGAAAALAALAALVFGVGDASAGNGRQTGRIEGTVAGSDGAPAVAARVTLSGEALTRPRHTETDGDGRFRFADLPPGVYDVVASVPGVGTASAIDVSLAIAGTRALALELGAGAEVIVVESSPIDATRATAAHRIDRAVFDDLPLRRTSFASLLQLLPGAAEDHNGLLLVRGGSWVDNQLIIDGVNYSDPITNSLLTRFDYYAVDAAELITGGMEAEYGEALGGVVNIVTRSGGDTHEIGGRVGVSPGLLSAKPDRADGTGRYDVNVSGGGPLIADRAKYFANLSYQRAFDPIPQQDGLDVADGETTNRVLGFGKLTWEPRAGHQFVLHTAGFWEQFENFRLDRVVLAEAQETNRTGGVTAQVNYGYRRPWGGIEASVGGYYLDSANLPASGDIETPAVVDLMTGVVSGNALEVFHTRNMRAQAQVSATRYADRWGSHELKIGAELALLSTLFESAHTGNEVVFTNGLPCVPEDGIVEGCVFAERSGTEAADGSLIPGEFSATARGLKLGLYARDAWRVGRGVYLHPGWRVDIGRVIGQSGDTLAAFDGVFGPRLGISWDVRERGTTAVRASASRYYQTGMLALPLFFGPSLRRERYRFNPATNQFDIFEPQTSTGGDNGGEIDLSRSEVAPHTDELVVGVDQALTRGLLVSVTGFYRRMTHLYDSLETNLVWNERGDTIVGFRDGTPEARFALFTDDSVFREYAAAELTVRGRFGRSGYVLASYTLARLYGTSDLDEITSAANVVPYVAANPRQRQFLYGPLKGDRRHVVKAAVAYGLPRVPVTVGVTFQAASGTPYSRLFFNSYLGGFFDRRAPRGIDPGDLNDPDDDRELRTDPLIVWNAFGAWDVSRWVALDHMSVELQIQNVLARDAAVQVEERDGVGAGGFGAPLIAQEAFRVQLGVSFRY